LSARSFAPLVNGLPDGLPEGLPNSLPHYLSDGSLVCPAAGCPAAGCPAGFVPLADGLHHCLRDSASGYRRPKSLFWWYWGSFSTSFHGLPPHSIVTYTQRFVISLLWKCYWLPEERQILLKNGVGENARQIASDIGEITKIIKKQREGKEWKIRIRGDVIVMNDIAMKTLRWVQVP
jgi:hypothetical protein